MDSGPNWGIVAPKPYRVFGTGKEISKDKTGFAGMSWIVGLAFQKPDFINNSLKMNPGEITQINNK